MQEPEKGSEDLKYDALFQYCQITLSKRSMPSTFSVNLLRAPSLKVAD
jgi:hypothetical protein